MRGKSRGFFRRNKKPFPSVKGPFRMNRGGPELSSVEETNPLVAHNLKCPLSILSMMPSSRAHLERRPSAPRLDASSFSICRPTCSDHSSQAFLPSNSLPQLSLGHDARCGGWRLVNKHDCCICLTCASHCAFISPWPCILALLI